MKVADGILMREIIGENPAKSQKHLQVEEGEVQSDGDRKRTPLTLAFEGGGMETQGFQVASKNWKRQGNEFFLELPEEIQSCQHLDSSPASPILDF